MLPLHVLSNFRKCKTNVRIGFIFFAIISFLPNDVFAQNTKVQQAPSWISKTCVHIVNYANKGELEKILIPLSPLSGKDQSSPEEIAYASKFGNVETYQIDINNDGKIEKVYIANNGESSLHVFPLKNRDTKNIPITFKYNGKPYDEERVSGFELRFVQHHGKVYMLTKTGNCLDSLFFINAQNEGVPVCWFGQKSQPSQQLTDPKQLACGPNMQLLNYVLSPVEIIKKMAGDEDVWEYAVSQPGANAVDTLIKGGEDINNTPNSSPLMIAVKNKRIDILEMLLKAGADPNVKTKDTFYEWPLVASVNENVPEAAKLLLKYGAGKNEKTCSIAFMWANNKDSIEMLDILLDNGVPIPDDRVAEAVRNGHHKVLKRLIARGLIDLNRKYTEEWPGGINIKQEAHGILSVNSNSNAKQVKITKPLMEFANNTWAIETLLTLKEEKAKQEGKCTPHYVNTSTAEAYVTPGESICGLSQTEWSWRYWEWSKSFPKGQHPADDQTGSVCMQNQSGSVIMLTGSSQVKPIKRSCEGLAGKHIFLPVLVSLAEQKQVFNTKELMHKVQDTMPKDASSIYVEIDGKTIADMKPFRQTLGCYFIDTYDGKSLAASDGYWVMLRPLAPGTHTIRFGGRFPDGFSQEIHYELTIK